MAKEIQKSYKYLKRIEFLKKHPNLHYIVYILKRFGNKEFYNFLWGETIYPSYIQLEKRGLLNKNINIFPIQIDSPRTGIGCYLRYTLLSLYTVDSLGFTPTVEWVGESWLKENHPINGSNNIFEYYFQPVSNIKLSDISESFHVFSLRRQGVMGIASSDLSNNMNPDFVAPYDVDEQYLENLGRICRKYLVFNETVYNYMNNSFIKLFGINNNISNISGKNRVLGIHIRGTDFNKHWEGHPNVVKPEDYKLTVDDALASGIFDKIFIATDDDNCLDWFKEQYKDKVIFYDDVYRSREKVNIAYQVQNRQDAHYLSGLEPLRDMYTLAYCDGIICGLSQVSICARIINRSLDKRFSFEKLLSNGIFHK